MKKIKRATLECVTEKQNEGRYVKAFELNFPYLCHLAAVLTHICDTKLSGWTDPRPVPQSYQAYREAVRRCEVHLSLCQGPPGRLFKGDNGF